MNTDCQAEESVHYVSVGGEIDVATAPTLRDQLVECLETGATIIVLDMTRVSFCDAQGLSVVAMMNQRVTLRIVIADTQFLWRVIRLCSLQKVLDVDLI